MMDKIMMDKIREYIEEKAEAQDMKTKKSVKLFVRKLCRVNLISRQQMLDLLCHVIDCWKQSSDAT